MKNEDLYPEILKKYLKNLKDIESKTQTTMVDYMNGIHMFLAYVMKNHSNSINFTTQLTKVNIKYITNKFLSNIKKKDVLEFLEYLQERGNVQSTKHQRLMAIRSFWDYLFNMEIVSEDITKGIKIPYKYKEQKYFSHEQMKKILNSIEQSNTNNKIRDYTIILMFLSLGLRNSELRNIKISDINMQTGELKILGKGKEIRYTYCKGNVIATIKKMVGNKEEYKNNER